MAKSTSKGSSPQEISHQLPANMALESCKELKEVFQGIVAEKGLTALTLDGKEVDRFGTTGLQLLFSLLNTCNEKKITLKFSNSSEEFLRCLNDLGCLELFKEQGLIA